MNCLFCQFVNGEKPFHKIWEDETHLGFLSIFPNTEGTSVVIPKAHYDSYAFSLHDDVLCHLILSAKKVARIIDNFFDDVGRTGLVFEGFGINHVHAKLFPLHGTSVIKEWRPIKSNVNDYYQSYPGYISSHDAERKEDAELAQLAKQIYSHSLC